MSTTTHTARPDVYSRITDKIIADLEQGVRPWMRPWNADHAAGRITRPLRHNGIPYKGINVVMLWSTSVAKGYSAPLWFTFKQALDLGGHVCKGETGELVVYADRITRTETDAKGEEVEKAIPFLKGYTVFNAEQCEGLPAHYYAKAEPPALDPLQRIEAADRFFAATGADTRSWSKLKKAELAALAEREITGTGWLPEPLRRTADTVQPDAEHPDMPAAAAA
jgi:antirestriction protein ArdC